MLATDQAHLYGNHIQVHGNHLRISDLEWGSLDIVEPHPLMFRSENLIREAHENAGVRHYGCVVECDFGFDPDMVANTMVSKSPPRHAQGSRLGSYRGYGISAHPEPIRADCEKPADYQSWRMRRAQHRPP